MPLQHNGDDPKVQTTDERVVLRPVVEPEQPKKSLATDPTVVADPRVKKAQARVDRLTNANAAGPVIARAERALQDARLDVLERAAERQAAAREKSLAAQKEARRLQIEREVLMRRSEMSPVLGIVFAGLRVNCWPERSNDSTIRLTAYGDWGKLMQLVSTSTTRVAGIARNASAPLQVFPLDVHRLRAEIEDLMRRSISHGLVRIEEI